MLDPRLVSLLRRLRIAPEKLRQARVSGPGAHLSKGLGQSLDFSEYRPYQAGDDLRALDWKVYGRTDRLYTKLYVPEQEETVWFLLDRSASMREKWPFLQQVVLGLATVALGQGDRVALRFLAREGQPEQEGLAPLRGRSGLARVANFLQQAAPLGVTDLDSALSETARRFKTRGHLVVVSDFLKEGAGLSGLSQLRYRRHRLTLLQLLTPEEIDPETALTPGEWELTDPEPEPPTDSDTVRLDLGRRSFQEYQSSLKEHNAGLADFARVAGAVYSLTPTDSDLNVFFSETLRREGLLI